MVSVICEIRGNTEEREYLDLRSSRSHKGYSHVVVKGVSKPQHVLKSVYPTEALKQYVDFCALTGRGLSLVHAPGKSLTEHWKAKDWIFMDVTPEFLEKNYGEKQVKSLKERIESASESLRVIGLGNYKDAECDKIKTDFNDSVIKLKAEIDLITTKLTDPLIFVRDGDQNGLEDQELLQEYIAPYGDLKAELENIAVLENAS